jgi:hypothetical protein
MAIEEYTNYESRLGASQMQQRQDVVEQIKQPVEEKPREKQTEPEKVMTPEEIRGLIAGMLQPILVSVATFETRLQGVSGNIIRTINGLGYIKKPEAQQIANEAVPMSLRGLDSDARRKSGDTLKLFSTPNGDAASWVIAKANGFAVKGTETLYYAITLREYDENGIIVARGGEIIPLPTGHTLKPTWDVVSIPDETLTAFSVTTIVNNNVTIYEGRVIQGTREPVTVPTQTIAVSHGQIIGLTYTFGGGAVLGVFNSFPLSASGTYVKALHKFDVIGGTASVAMTYHRGSIQIDGCYA